MDFVHRQDKFKNIKITTFRKLVLLPSSGDVRGKEEPASERSLFSIFIFYPGRWTNSRIQLVPKFCSALSPITFLPSGQQLTKCRRGTNSALAFLTIHEKPYPLPHYYGMSQGVVTASNIGDCV